MLKGKFDNGRKIIDYRSLFPIEKLRERRRFLIVKSAERFAKAATKSGLTEMEIADEEVDRIFEEIAARFRKEEKKGADGASAPTRRPANGSAGSSILSSMR